MTAVIHISQQWIYRPANVGMAHSNQQNFLEHSEEPYKKYRYLRLIPNLQLTSGPHRDSQRAANSPWAALCPGLVLTIRYHMANSDSLDHSLPHGQQSQSWLRDTDVLFTKRRSRIRDSPIHADEELKAATSYTGKVLVWLAISEDTTWTN